MAKKRTAKFEIRIGIYTIVAFMLLSIMGMVVLLEAIFADPRPEPRPAQWTAPEIPQCDLPLWDRIRYKCDE